MPAHASHVAIRRRSGHSTRSRRGTHVRHLVSVGTRRAKLHLFEVSQRQNVLGLSGPAPAAKTPFTASRPSSPLTITMCLSRGLVALDGPRASIAGRFQTRHVSGSTQAAPGRFRCGRHLGHPGRGEWTRGPRLLSHHFGSPNGAGASALDAASSDARFILSDSRGMLANPGRARP